MVAQSTALVSPLPYFIGYKPDGNLNYIKQNTLRNIHFIAVNPELKQQELNDLKIQLAEQRPVSTLVKKPDGTFQYQSIIQTRIIQTHAFSIQSQGTEFKLPTQQLGDFVITVLDKNKTELSQFKYTVVGASQASLAKNAELNIKLNSLIIYI